MEVQLGGHAPDVFLDVPDRFPAASLLAEEDDVIIIDLRMVSQDQAEQGGLSRSVGTKQGPALARADGPVNIAQDDAVPVTNSDVAQANQFAAGRVFRPCGTLAPTGAGARTVLSAERWRGRNRLGGS